MHPSIFVPPFFFATVKRLSAKWCNCHFQTTFLCQIFIDTFCRTKMFVTKSDMRSTQIHQRIATGFVSTAFHDGSPFVDCYFSIQSKTKNTNFFVLLVCCYFVRFTKGTLCPAIVVGRTPFHFSIAFKRTYSSPPAFLIASA